MEDMVILIQEDPLDLLQVVYVVSLSALPHVGVLPGPVVGAPPQWAGLAVLPMMLSLCVSGANELSPWSWNPIIIISFLDLETQLLHHPSCLTLVQQWELPRMNRRSCPWLWTSLAKLSLHLDLPSVQGKVVSELWGQNILIWLVVSPIFTFRSTWTSCEVQTYSSSWRSHLNLAYRKPTVKGTHHPDPSLTSIENYSRCFGLFGVSWAGLGWINL